MSDSTRSQLPMPPANVALRVSGTAAAGHEMADWIKIGESEKARILRFLPANWSWEGKRVLDFGCGAGRLLYQFEREARVAEFHGCDIHAPSIEWLKRHWTQFHVFCNEERPPLNRPTAHFDLIWALSVFTHIDDLWAEWLLEMHRLLAPGGLLLLTFYGSQLSGDVAVEPWDEDRIGMNVLDPGRNWDDGGPSVMHSPWWIRAHWGRLFEIEALEDGKHRFEQGTVLMRPKPVRVTPSDLRSPEPKEPREFRALTHNIRQLQRELIRHRRFIDEATAHARANSLPTPTLPMVAVALPPRRFDLALDRIAPDGSLRRRALLAVARPVLRLLSGGNRSV